MAGVFYFPLIGTPTAEGNQLSFYVTGTNTPLDVWTDSDLTLAWAQPIILNAVGESNGPIYVSPTPAYKVVYEDSEGVAIPGYPVDFVSPSTIMALYAVPVVTVLTDAQIKALPTTPMELIPAPSAGLRVKLLACSLNLSNTAGAYTNINTTSCLIWVGPAGPASQTAGSYLVNDSSLAPNLTQVTNWLGANTSILVDLVVPALQTVSDGAAGKLWVVPNDGNFPGSTASLDWNAKTLKIFADNNGSGAFTGGNAANTLTITTYYALESVV